MRMDGSSGKSIGRRCAICAGLHALAHLRCCRRPCRRPFQGTWGPGTSAPLGVITTPASRSCTYCRSLVFITSLASLGRRAARSACHCAVVARYSKVPPRVAALRLSSREMVDGERFIARATSRTPFPCARSSAIRSRSSNDRYLPEGGLDPGFRCEGGIPPAIRNHRTPTAGETRALRAASSDG